MGIPKVIFISNYNDLALNVCEKFMEKGCHVTVVSNDARWQEQFSPRALFEQMKKDITQDEITEDFDYAICLTASGFKWEGEDSLLIADLAKIDFTKKLASKRAAKTAFLFSLRQNKKNHDKLLGEIKKKINAELPDSARIYLGDIFSNDEKIGGALFSLLKRTKSENAFLNDSESKTFYPLTVDSAVREIIKLVLSLKAYSKDTALMGRSLSVSRIYGVLKREVGETLERKELVSGKIKIFEVDEKLYVEDKIAPELIKVFRKLNVKKKSASKEKSPVTQKDTKLSLANGTKKDKRITIIRRWIYASLGLLFSLLVAPLGLVFLGVLSLSASKFLITEGFLGSAGYGLRTTFFAINISQSYSSAMSKTPLLGAGYVVIEESSSLLSKEVQMGERVLEMLNLGLDITNAISKDLNYDVEGKSSLLSLESEALYSDLGFFESELSSSSLLSQRIARIPISELDMGELRKKLLNLKAVLESLPLVLGNVGSPRYVFLLQDNSDLRPTGGRIVNYSLVTFSNGNIFDRKTFDTKDLDASIQGRVEPPTPLETYFGKNFWQLEDANWDPDFSVSATQAEWFLDKAINTSSEGAVGYDFDFIKATEDMLTDFSSLNDRQKVRLGKVVLFSLNNRNLQVFSKNQKVQRALEELGWAGLVSKPLCSGNCYSDFLMVLETSEGERGKSVRREGEFSSSLQEGIVKRRLTLFLENRGDESYKTYLRVWVPGESGFSPVNIISADENRQVTPDKKGIRGFSEAGVYMKIPVKGAVAVIFNWEGPMELNFENEGEYLLLWRKQAGIGPYPFEITIDAPKDLEVSFDSPLSLTERGDFNYNSNLSEDFSTRIHW